MVIEFSLANFLVVWGFVTNPVWKQFLNYTRIAVAETQFQISDSEFVNLYKLSYTPWFGISWVEFFTNFWAFDLIGIIINLSLNPNPSGIRGKGMGVRVAIDTKNEAKKQLEWKQF